MPKFSSDVLLAAIEGLEIRKRRIDRNIAEVKARLNENNGEAIVPPPAPKRVISAAGRQRMIAGLRRHHAERRRQLGEAADNQTNIM